MGKKKPIVTPFGQWEYPGEVTIIPSNNITMQGVNYPVLGIDNLGNQELMMPGMDYTFPGDYVTEIPQMGKGGLTQWFAEEWTDIKTGKPCGRSGKDKEGRPYPACRPKKRVNETTPKTTSEMSSAEKAKFKREKTSGKRIDYNHKRREEGGEIGWLNKYQEGGQLPEDYEQFKKFQETLPNNLKDPNYKYNDPNSYDLYGMWNASDKPSSFSNVKDSYLFPLQDDGTYHGFSVSPKTGEFLKPKNHPSTWMEVYQAQFNPDLQNQSIIQNERGRLQYVPRTMQRGGTQPPNFERIEQVNIKSKQAPWYVRYPRMFGRAIDNKLTDFGHQYAQRISNATGGSEWYKQSNPFMNVALESMNAPQLAATYAVTGKVQTPSEAMHIQNPYGAFAVDALLDPAIAFGVGRGIVKGAPAAARYATTQTPLKNTYKYNPWAFKPNEVNWYRQVGQSAIDDALDTRLIREAGEEVSPRMWEEFQGQLKRLQGDDAALDYSERYRQQMLASRRPNSPFFAKGKLFYPMDRKPTITKTGKLSKNPAGKGNADYLIETSLSNESFQPAYVKGMSLGVPAEIGETAILKPNPNLRTLDNFNLYKRDWLRGYKPIEVPKSNKKYGSWLDEYQGGGETSTEQNPDRMQEIKIAATSPGVKTFANTLFDGGKWLAKNFIKYHPGLRFTTKVLGTGLNYFKDEVFDKYRPIEYPDVLDAIIKLNNPSVEPLKDKKGNLSPSEEAWRKGLGFKDDFKYIRPASYKPANSEDNDTEYVRFENMYDPQKLINAYVKAQKELKPGETKVLIPSLDPYIKGRKNLEASGVAFSQQDPLQNFTLDKGEDEKGKYISLYDVYDFGPLITDLVYGFKKPYEVYDRFYYEKNKQGIPVYKKKDGGQTNWLEKYK